MRIPFETELVRQCAPTLAGLKASSLFRFVFPPTADPFRLVASVSRILESKHLDIALLQYDVIKRSGLLFVYRPKALESIMDQPENLEFFRRRGYSGPGWEDILTEMSLLLATRASFPHEIGILLGYPLEDVEGYLVAPREKDLCSGCWKAYSHPARARRFFEKCRKCTRIYCQCYANGTALSQLAVA